MKSLIPAVLIVIWAALFSITPFTKASARQAQENLQTLQKSTQDIRSLRSRIQKTAATFLVVSRELGADETSNPARLTVIQEMATIRQTDLVTSEIIFNTMAGDQWPVVAERGDWYQVKLDDGRPGWIHRDDIQLIGTENNSSVLASDPGPARSRQMAETLYNYISAQHDTAQSLFTTFSETYESLSATARQAASGLNNLFNSDKEQIETSLIYVRHYYAKLGPVNSLPNRSAQNNGLPFTFNGTASANFGTALYESAGEVSETARNINISGQMVFNPKSSLSLNLRNNSSVIQTPYTTSDANVTYHYQTESGTRLQGTLLYQNYRDKNLTRNDFSNVGARLNVDHPLNGSTRLFGDFGVNSKSYSQSGGNDFSGGDFRTGVEYNAGTTRVNAGIRGRIQSSDVSALDYQRFMPNLRLVFDTGSGSIALNAEVEQITYDTGAAIRDFTRERIDLDFSGQQGTTRLSVIAKQSPNNEALDNIKFRVGNQWNRSNGGNRGRSSVSLLYVTHTNEMSPLTDYLDLRYDRNRSGQNGYFDVGAFGRYWMADQIDHSVNLFSRFGLSFSGFEIGPVVGAQIMLNPDDLAIERAGNSFRAGIDARANVVIDRATIHGSFRYQKSLVYSSGSTIDPGSGMFDVASRNPTTIQATAGVRTPILDYLDLQADLSYYNVDLDVTGTAGMDPIEMRSGLRILAGVVYRFNNR